MLQLAGHFVCDKSTERPPHQPIWTSRLYRADCVDVRACHCFDRGRQRFARLQSGSLQAIDGLIWSKMSRQIGVAENLPQRGMDTENRQPDAGGSKWHEGPRDVPRAMLVDGGSKCFDGGIVKQRTQWKLGSKGTV